MQSRVLVTGSAGYVGSVLACQLLERGYYVRGLDALFFGDGALIPVASHANFEFVHGDIRSHEVVQIALHDIDAVVHLAAIVGDPACAKQPDLAEEVNWTASRELLDACVVSPGVKRFIFASTCSNYGKMGGDGFVSENSPLNPVSLYARLKVRFEEYALNFQGRSDLAVTALRFATAHGLSPRMRFDLTVNEFVREVSLGRTLVVFGEQFWRPYCHVEDIARACVTVLESDPRVVANEVFGAGDTDENYQKKTLAELLVQVVPDLRVQYVHKEEDPRDYRVNFSKIRDTLGFSITRRVPDSIREIHRAIRSGIIRDPDAAIYRNA